MMNIVRLSVALAAFFIAGSAFAQNPGTVTSHAFAVGKGPGVQGFGSVLCGLAQVAIGQTTADPICRTLTGDVTINAGGVTAVNNLPTGTTMAGSIVGTIIGGAAVPATGFVGLWVDSTTLRLRDVSSTGVIGTTVVADAGAANNFLTGITAFGGITKAQPSISNLSGWGTSVLAAAGNPLNAASGLVGFSGAFGTPTSLIGTNITGIAAGLTAGTVTTNANLTGPVTSVGNTTSIGTNQVSRANEAQGLARSVIGNSTNAAANVADIQGTTANTYLGVNSAGTGLAYSAVNLASTGVTGTLPIANGGTGDTGTAWTPYTPTMACNGGTGTWSALGRSKTIGKTVFLSIAITLSAIGTCTVSNPQVTLTLPFTAQSPVTMLVRETGLTGVAYQGYGVAASTTITLASMAGGNVALATGDVFVGSAVYEGP
jgi:hypothetical protein